MPYAGFRHQSATLAATEQVIEQVIQEQPDDSARARSVRGERWDAPSSVSYIIQPNSSDTPPPPIAPPRRNASPPLPRRFSPLAAATPPRSPSRRPTRRDVAATLAAVTPRCSAAPRAALRPCPPISPSRRARRGASRRDARRRDATTLTYATSHSSRRRRDARRRDAAILGCAAGRAAAVPTHLSIATRKWKTAPPKQRPVPGAVAVARRGGGSGRVT